MSTAVRDGAQALYDEVHTRNLDKDARTRWLVEALGERVAIYS